MKPINLKIKGLNSFENIQEIDFTKLTEKGIFGIFGSTGSGKSTILDGMTLALYGQIPRNSSNFMNVNCNTLYVSYQFQISDTKVKTYKVEREFRRDKKSGNVRSKDARITSIEENTEMILEEGSKNVTEKCQEILGLRLEDFTRTVVLPQGKFSEFLRLEGKDRRNMLERLFGLHEYGDMLSIKLLNKIKEEKQKQNILEIELKNYENANSTTLNDKIKVLLEIKKNYEKYEIEFKDAEENFNDSEKLWRLQQELEEYILEEQDLKKQENKINENQIKVTLGESILKIKPYIDNYENTLTQIKSTDNELNDLTIKIDAINKSKTKIEKSLELAKDKKENELPSLKIKRQRILDAINETALLNDLMNQKKDLKNYITKIEKNLKDISTKMDESETDIITMNNNINLREQKIDKITFSEDYKNKVNEALVLLNNHEHFTRQKNKLSKDTNSTLLAVKKSQNNIETLLKILKKKQTIINTNKNTLKDFIKNCPGDQNTLLTLQQELSFAKDKWDKYEDYTSSLHKSNLIVDAFSKDLHIKQKKKLTLESDLNKINTEIKKIEIENIAYTLRKTLSKGEMCPVCGSKEHSIENLKAYHLSNLKELTLNLKHKEDSNNKLAAKIIKIQANIQIEEQNIEDKGEKINKLGEDFKSVSPNLLKKELEELKITINNYINTKNDLEEKIKLLTEEKNSLNIEYNKEYTLLIQNQNLLKELQKDLKSIQNEFEKNKENLLRLKNELSIEDFRGKQNEIFQKGKEKNALEGELKILRDKLKFIHTKKEELNKKLALLREELKEKSATLFEKSKSIQEKENSIKTKVGTVKNLELTKSNIDITIKKIEEEYINTVKCKDEIAKQYTLYNNHIISIQSNLLSLKERGIKDKINLENALSEEKISNINQAKENFITGEEINKLKLQIEEYKSCLTRLTGTIENLKKKINNRHLTEQQWIEIQNIKKEKNDILNLLTENRIKLEIEITSIKKQLEQKNTLLHKKKEFDYKVSLLDDLEKLFKGKKFVEFVAGNQLKYISLDADKKLREITCGNYGLEIDEDGRFFIRDYKNGGKKRGTSTLSGGETFVTSLALALALSAQIQLKGRSPLELFFLDEGFGTLDDNLLETVMDSLEKIHNNRLSIGVISHLDVIKERMPVKLIVTSAESGMGGSKVRIEKN